MHTENGVQAMGVRNRQRRAAKAKERQRRARKRASYGMFDDGPFDLGEATRARWVHDVLVTALGSVDLDRPSAPIPHVQQLADAAGQPEFASLIDEILAQLIADQMPLLWKRGWQPADVVQVLRRVVKADALMLTMAVDSMAAHVATFAPTTVDERFTGQLTELRADATSWNTVDFVNEWSRRTEVTASAVVGTVVVLAETLARLPSIAVLCPPPGTPRARGPRRSGVDPKVLERVRALLAKAESSDYDAEAESLTAKAQDLMARYSIDHALLGATGPTPDGPAGIRIAVDNPYETEKAMLLDRVARANRSQAIRSSHLGFVTVLGFEADLRAVELLYTSLLVQVTRALQREGSRPTRGGGNRTVAFRRSFQQAFAVRIGERLSGVSEASARQGAADDQRLLPVLAGREQAVKQFTDRLFPDIVVEQATPTYDREGWTLGTHAADLAPLTAIPSLDNEHRRAPAAKASLPDPSAQTLW